MPNVVAEFLEKRQASLQPQRSGKGGRVLAGLLSGASTWGWPGNWSQDRIEQAHHFKHWLYVAINRRGNSIAECKPNVGYVTASRPASGQRRSANPYHAKSLQQVQSHEQVELLDADHPLSRLLARPNETDTWGQLLYELMLFLDLTGNAYLWMVPNALGQPCELWVIPSHWVWVRNGHGRWVDYYEIRPFVGTGILRFPPEEVLWLKRKSPIHKYDGWAPTTAIAEWIDAAESIDRSRFWQFKNGAFPFGHLKLGESYLDPDEPDLERAYARLFGRLQGESNYGRPLVTGADVEYTPLMISPMEMAYTQSADQLRDWVLAAYGVPKEVAGIQDAGSEIAMYGPMLQYCRFSLAPDLKLLGDHLTQHLCHRWDERIRLWYDDPTPENPEQKRADLQAQFTLGAVTPNEVRAAYGYEPYAHGGDDPLLPMGMGPLPLNTGEDVGDLGLTPAEQARYGSTEEEDPDEDPLTAAAAGNEPAQKSQGTLTPEQIQKLGQQLVEELLAEWEQEQGGKGFFSDCDRDDAGHCLPSGQAGGSTGALQPGHAESWAKLARKLPAKVLSKAKEKVSQKYQLLEGRYGKKYAVAILGAGLAGVPVPLPGASLLTAAPVIAIAELHRRLSGTKSLRKDSYFEDCPRDDAGHCEPSSGSGASSKPRAPLTAEHHQIARRTRDALQQTTHLSEEQKKSYQDSSNHVLKRMSGAAAQRLLQNTKQVAFYGSVEQVGQALAARSPKLAAALSQGARVNGAYSPRTGDLHLDGGGKQAGEMLHTAEIYAHEYGHAIDGPAGAKLSEQAAWQAAWKQEAAGLSRYATTSPAEGFAEFSRALHSGRVTPAVLQQRFPAMHAVWEKEGLFS